MWNAARRAVRGFFSAPFQLVLVIAFSLVAAFTILIGAGAISRTIRDYLAVAMTERVERDMQLAQALYQEVAAVDTATIFLGDLRVSTNVHGLDGKRAIGTRLSKEVTQVVLGQGRPYTARRL